MMDAAAAESPADSSCATNSYFLNAEMRFVTTNSYLLNTGKEFATTNSCLLNAGKEFATTNSYLSSVGKEFVTTNSCLCRRACALLSSFALQNSITVLFCAPNSLFLCAECADVRENTISLYGGGVITAGVFIFRRFSRGKSAAERVAAAFEPHFERRFS